MNGGLTTSPPPSCPVRLPAKPYHGHSSSFTLFRSFSSILVAPRGLPDYPLCPSKLKYSRSGSEKFSRFGFRCNSSANPGGPSGQENEIKSVLDAFFLGKALAEALNERIESTVGEFLSTIGRLQAEQQKQVQDFQEEVLERAQRAKEKAALEAMEARGLIPESSTENTSTVSNGIASGTTSSARNSATPENSSNTSVQPTTTNPNARNEDPLLGVSNED